MIGSRSARAACVATWAAACAIALGAGGDASARRAPADAVELPTGEAAYAALAPAPVPSVDYLMVPGDTLIVRVFQEPELSSDAVVIDGGGHIQMPLIGEVAAAGRSPAAVAAETTARLRRRYLVNPQVTVSLKTAAVRSVSVEGQVVKPGVYEIDRDATLLTAIAKAESPTRVARGASPCLARGEQRALYASSALTEAWRG